MLWTVAMGWKADFEQAASVIVLCGEFTMPSRREVWGFAVELAIAVAILAVASVAFAGVWNALKWLVGW